MHLFQTGTAKYLLRRLAILYRNRIRLQLAPGHITFRAHGCRKTAPASNSHNQHTSVLHLIRYASHSLNNSFSSLSFSDCAKPCHRPGVGCTLTRRRCPRSPGPAPSKATLFSIIPIGHRYMRCILHRTLLFSPSVATHSPGGAQGERDRRCIDTAGAPIPTSSLHPD
jgi:hypothetical protein